MINWTLPNGAIFRGKSLGPPATKKGGDWDLVGELTMQNYILAGRWHGAVLDGYGTFCGIGNALHGPQTFGHPRLRIQRYDGPFRQLLAHGLGTGSLFLCLVRVAHTNLYGFSLLSGPNDKISLVATSYRTGCNGATWFHRASLAVACIYHN